MQTGRTGPPGPTASEPGAGGARGEDARGVPAALAQGPLARSEPASPSPGCATPVQRGAGRCIGATATCASTATTSSRPHRTSPTSSRRSAAIPSRSSGASRHCPAATGYSAGCIRQCVIPIIGGSAWGDGCGQYGRPTAGRCGRFAVVGAAGPGGAEQADKRSARTPANICGGCARFPSTGISGMSCSACSMPPT
jgi:hypothetical protein